MSEARKNHLSLEGGLVKDDEHVASYKPIPENDTVPDFRTSKSSLAKSALAKSKEKVSSDGAEEKLLAKEDEAKITTRVDMADAKYVVGDHRNGDAKIELDANKRQFSGLTKEELMKYADDPFWVRLRWFMFILFWALWLCMLAGAIAIIVQTPKCPSRAWYENGPLVDMSSEKDYSVVEDNLPILEQSKVAGIFVYSCEDAYEVLDDPSSIDKFKDLVVKAKAAGVKVIVDLTANFVSEAHTWFQKSKNKTLGYSTYFVWRPGQDKGADSNDVIYPNNWVSTYNTSAWKWNADRGEYYLQRFRDGYPDLNMTNPQLVKKFNAVLKKWMVAGAAGVRLHHARELLIDQKLTDEVANSNHKINSLAAVHTDYAFWEHKHTSDQPKLDGILEHWSHVVDMYGSPPGAKETVFTLAEEPNRSELFFTSLRPPSLAPMRVRSAPEAAAALNSRLANWPAVQLLASEDDSDEEIALFSLLLPATPVLAINQLKHSDNSTEDNTFAELVDKRDDASLQLGQYQVASVRANNSTDELLACARWKPDHAAYVAVYNPLQDEARANLTTLQSLPADLSVYKVSKHVRAYTNYTESTPVYSESVLVPPKSTVVLLYVPKKDVEK